MAESRKERSRSRWELTNRVAASVHVLPKQSHRLAVLLMQIESSQPHLKRVYGPYAFQMTGRHLAELMGVTEDAAKRIIVELKNIGILEVLQARYGRQRAVYQLAYAKDRPQPPKDPVARAREQREAKKKRDAAVKSKRDELRERSKGIENEDAA